MPGSPRELTDEELIAEFQNGNETAFNELVRRYKDPLTNFAYRFMGDWDDCSDVVQETFVRVYRSRHSYKPVARFSTWVYTIATNLAKSHLRRRRFRNVFSRGRGNQGEPDKVFDPPSLENNPDHLADSSILGERIQSAIGSLGVKYREVIILRDVQDLSYEEIAKITKINVGTVKSRLNRARTQLQSELKDYRNE